MRGGLAVGSDSLSVRPLPYYAHEHGSMGPGRARRITTRPTGRSCLERRRRIVARVRAQERGLRSGLLLRGLVRRLVQLRRVLAPRRGAVAGVLDPDLATDLDGRGAGV